MMMDPTLGPKGKIGTAIALTVALGATSAPVASGQEHPPADAPVRAPTVKPVVVSAGDLAGTVVDVDGKTPCGGAVVVIRDANGQVVARSPADADGRFRFAERPAGVYRLEVGRAAGVLVVRPGAAPKTLVLVVPSAIALPVRAAADESGEQPKEKDNNDDRKVSLLGVEMSETTAAAIAFVATAGVVGGVTAAIVGNADNNGSSHHHHNGSGEPPSP